VEKRRYQGVVEDGKRGPNDIWMEREGVGGEGWQGEERRVREECRRQEDAGE